MLTPEKVVLYLSQHGTCKSQASNLWQGELALPEHLVNFYQQVGPENISIPGGLDNYFLPSLFRLWKFQEGYSWNNLTAKNLFPDWPHYWIVVSAIEANPFIYDNHRKEIGFAYHGEGNWSPRPVFPDLYVMAASFAVFGTWFSKTDHLSSDEQEYTEVLQEIESFFPKTWDFEKTRKVLMW